MMAFELFAAVALGVGAAGVVMILNTLGRRTLGRTLPRVAIPLAVGLGMIAYGIWSEYSWYDRTAGGLPEGMAVTVASAEPSPFRPWTYAYPFIGRFAAVDLAAARRNPAAPGQVLVDTYFFARFAPPTKVPAVIDCRAARRADLADGAQFDEAGRLLDADWRAAPPDDPLFETVCTAEDREPTPEEGARDTG